jgi:hypothetical protein
LAQQTLRLSKGDGADHRVAGTTSEAQEPKTLVALKEAGIDNVTLYFGSWNEWSRDPALPIETGLPYAAAPSPGVAA